MKIREIEEKDNAQVKEVVQAVLVEMGVPKVGTAYEDKSLDDMFRAYSRPGMSYFVVEHESRIVGGAGIAPLEHADPSICELQKMYFLPQARGKGVGAEMMKTCLSMAQLSGYKQCYLETMPYMEGARKLYARSGFRELEAPVGDTGHYNCQMWMIRDLEAKF